jgi:hypothetical protein
MDQSGANFAAFSPQGYLDYYYGHIGDENRALLEFFALAYKDIPKGAIMMEFGGGPTVYQVISAAAQVAAIDFCDYLRSNLDEVRLWLDNKPEAFRWEKFIKYALEKEGLSATAEEISRREAAIRQKVRKLVRCDARQSDPCGFEYRNRYDVLGAGFVPECIGNTKEDWRHALGNILSLLKPGGVFVTVAVLEAEYCRYGEVVLPVTYLEATDYMQYLPQLGLKIQILRTIPSEVMDKTDPAYTGYNGMIFIKAIKS